MRFLFPAETYSGRQCSARETHRGSPSGRSIHMPSRLLLVAFLSLFLAGCNNTLNPLCGSARPVPSIGSLSPSSVTFSQVQQGTVLTVNGSQFVAASEILINGKALSATPVSSTQLKLTRKTG